MTNLNLNKLINQYQYYSFRRHAMREHKWDPTDAEMANIYCVNETPPLMQYAIRELRSVNVENEQSD